MAKALVNNLAAEWDPGKYTDQYRENLLRIIQGKVKGKEVELEPMAETHDGKVVDLMERLRRSLEQSGQAGAKQGGRTRRPTRPGAAREIAADKPSRRSKKGAARKRPGRAA
jgi:DNA end-binding protein Ku